MKPLRKFIAHMAGGLGVIALTLFFLAFSCSQKMPTSPVVSQTPNPAAGLVVPPSAGPTPNLSVIGGLLDLTFSLAKKVIGVLGGILSIPIQNTTYNSLLVIPLGALTQDVTISAGGRFDKVENATFYDFGPDGLVFLKPVSLVHRCGYVDGMVLNLWYLNPKTGRWEKAG